MGYPAQRIFSTVICAPRIFTDLQFVSVSCFKDIYCFALCSTFSFKRIYCCTMSCPTGQSLQHVHVTGVRPREWCYPILGYHITGELFFYNFLYVFFSTLLNLPTLRFHCVQGCLDQTQDFCNFSIGNQML
jgi:hypothetical protein